MFCGEPRFTMSEPYADNFDFVPPIFCPECFTGDLDEMMRPPAHIVQGCKEAGDRWLALEPVRQAVREALPQPIWEEVLEELQ